MIHTIPHYLAISPTLATSGQPRAEHFTWIQQAGYKTVINLAPVDSGYSLINEADLVTEQGMDYVYIPVIWENPTLENFATFVQAIEARKEQKKWVHCAMNMRVSAFIYLYNCLYNKMSEAEAKIKLETIWTPNKVWQNYINNVFQKGI
ncbi:protein tyrosine phosphatase family protein [Spirulina subsalsa FACHB-351]|uniref:Protein tyrosine phosphatase family protein n=1 Tax=Spirulina subsalsa FACHB-351 TaxID=234711 RepID=A0ABT3L5V1_9CYAN|nr:protein tyrosine phosphatase family protein [Spirulina subsalsa]MCW6036890.1 protein tyrosine phosphatase family protein [Spirulina subsalsa FACHB-351]